MKHPTIDHTVPIHGGFNRLTQFMDAMEAAEKIGSVENLAWMELGDNIDKGTRLTPQALALIDKWQTGL